MNEVAPIRSKERPLPDHADASAEVLENAARRIRNGECVEDVAYTLIPIIRIMARRT